MHPEHAKLLEDLRAAARPVQPGPGQNDSYNGSGRPFFNISAPVLRDVAKGWTKPRKTAAPSEILAVIDSLFAGASHEEKTLASLMLAYHEPARLASGPPEFDRWLGEIRGWAEVDSLCWNVITAEQMLADWPAWSAFLSRLARDPNINKRRAALVLPAAPAHYSDDTRLRDLAFANVDVLKAEKPILITKAVSWLLRSMTTRHRAAVEAYLGANAESLPKVAIRETRTKLRTGTKSGR
jgi:3-methyladenine DNA glycosylase AlkD